MGFQFNYNSLSIITIVPQHQPLPPHLPHASHQQDQTPTLPQVLSCSIKTNNIINNNNNTNTNNNNNTNNTLCLLLHLIIPLFVPLSNTDNPSPLHHLTIYEARTLQSFAVSGVQHASMSVSDTDTTPILRVRIRVVSGVRVDVGAS